MTVFRVCLFVLFGGKERSMSVFELKIDEEELSDDPCTSSDGPRGVLPDIVNQLVSSASNTEQIILPPFVMVISYLKEPLK